LILTSDWLRERFASPRSYTPEIAGDRPAGIPPEQLRAASVLVPVVDHGDELGVLFTRRTAHLHDHAGQISFPGGRAEPSDSNAAETALRETEEEIGLHRRHIFVLGSINDYVTVSGYRVTPIVGLIEPPFELRPDSFEVAEVFEVPLRVLLDPANHQRNTVVHNGVPRHYYAIPHEAYYIWGATAGMLMNLYRFLTSDSLAGRVDSR
jgi:8-oxo-dGTP pyrophosphatase MutT (NUDIX family)